MEKFALLNLLKALETLSAPKNKDNTEENNDVLQQNPSATQPKETVAPPQTQYTNVMSSVLERHEAISYRIKNKRSV